MLVRGAQADEALRNTEELAAVYKSHALDARALVADLTTKAKPAAREFAEAKASGVKSRVEAARKTASDSMRRIREARAREDKYTALHERCEEIGRQIRESKEMQSTVAALAGAQTHLGRMRLDGVLDPVTFGKNL
jgi:uncharacterized sporulation protein YeaH/YhbH (DUF444 family)